MDHATKRIILLVLIATISQVVKGHCELSDLGKYPCEGKLSCSGDFGPAAGYMSDWACRRRGNYDYNYGYRRPRVDDYYNIYVEATEIDGTSSFDPFGYINEQKDHILTISITNGKMNSVPAAIFNLPNAKTVDISSNTIESLNLDAFLKQKSLNLLNVSCNQIVDLEVGERSPSTDFSAITTIDLSYNAITAIPNNYFRQFQELLHLNLSHNYIKSFDILTFEGITQLKTLYISHNELTNLGLHFARFVFLQELFLDHNYLVSIEGNNFNKMTKLEKLNISSNSLITIEDTAFDRLVELNELDLSNNKINITKTMFQYNSALQSVHLSSNRISKLEPGAFEGKHINNFEIHNNPIVGSLQRNTFQGICTKSLDLSGANITELGPELFDGQFQSLNFSRNSISKIHNTTFSKLELLTDLDLSYNQLQNIDFYISNLKHLLYFYINNNNIRKIKKNMFDSLTSLKIIDLSNNAIDDIDMLSFEDLNELESLILSNNPLLTVIPPQMFSGLASSTDLDFTNTRINTIQNNAFNGMESLKAFNSSHSNLTVLEINAFSGTGSIEIIDLSYNQIETFSLNNTNIQLVKKIYLQYNKLQHVTDKTFAGLLDLSLLNLKGNNLVRIGIEAFLGLRNLLKVDLSDNKDMVFHSSIFSNLQSLAVVLLSNVSSGFSFESIVNTSIASLDLSFCDIIDVNLVQLYQIVTIERLKLASNKIRSINKISFQKLRHLSWIDLSNNRLSSIQPGTFSDTEDLSVLDLSHNFLSSLKFGVFDGLVNLKTLDLSSNILHSFSVSLFHNTPRIQIVFLDDNLIDNLDFEEFAKANITKLYVGGNPIPCDNLTRLKKNININGMFSVKAKNEIYDIENVNGITCKSKTNIDDSSQMKSNDTALTKALTGTLEEFRVTVERFLNRNESKIDLESIGFRNVSTSIEHFLEVFNKSETKNNAFLEKQMDINNSTNRVLENIQEYIKLRYNIAIDSDTNTEVKLNNDEIEKTMINMLAKEKPSLKTEFKNMFDDWKTHNVGGNHLEAQTPAVGGSSDLKFALYFIAICLAALLCMLVLTFVFVFFKLRNIIPMYSSHLMYNRKLISNDIEMF